MNILEKNPASKLSHFAMQKLCENVSCETEGYYYNSHHVKLLTMTILAEIFFCNLHICYVEASQNKNQIIYFLLTYYQISFVTCMVYRLYSHQQNIFLETLFERFKLFIVHRDVRLIFYDEASLPLLIRLCVHQPIFKKNRYILFQTSIDEARVVYQFGLGSPKLYYRSR